MALIVFVHKPSFLIRMSQQSRRGRHHKNNFYCLIWKFDIYVLFMSYSMRVEPRNFRRTWNILVVVFLNCSCEINFRAPSRLQDIEKVSWLEKKIFHSDSFFFFDTAKNKKVNKQSSSMTISRFDADRIWHGEHISDIRFSDYFTKTVFQITT